MSPGSRIATRYPTPTQLQAIRAGQTNLPVAVSQKMSQQARNRSLAIGARHAHEGNSTIVLALEQVVDNGLANRSRAAACGVHVHQQPRPCIYLYDGAPLLLQRLRNIFD